MPPPATFSTRLEASAYHSPIAGSQWQPLRDAVIKQALAMGFEEETMMERGVHWYDDQDPFGHIANPAYGNFASAQGVRIFESFEAQLGKEKMESLMSGKGIGVVLGDYNCRFRRPVSYPDSVSLFFEVCLACGWLR
jgi:acyl-CoA thioesterase FadM